MIYDTEPDKAELFGQLDEAEQYLYAAKARLKSTCDEIARLRVIAREEYQEVIELEKMFKEVAARAAAAGIKV